MIDWTGQQLGSYRLRRRLGSGGFATVYLGQHVRVATQYAALKVLHMSDVDSHRFQLEAETTAALVHPNIIRLFDFDIAGAVPFLVMDYAPGGSLRTRHPLGSQLPLSIVVAYVSTLGNAIGYAHDKNIVHRDLKPENVLLGTQGELRLSDFGLAVLSQTGRTTLNPGYGTSGTAWYMAPEQARGKPEKASDQYALAVMAYEWLCGTPPFTQGNAINIQFQHTYEPVPPLREKLPSLPEAVEQVLLTALAKNPRDRFATVQAFARAFEQAQTPTGDPHKKISARDSAGEHEKQLQRTFLTDVETLVSRRPRSKYSLVYATGSGAVALGIFIALGYSLSPSTLSSIILFALFGVFLCSAAGFITAKFTSSRRMGWIAGALPPILFGLLGMLLTPSPANFGIGLLIILLGGASCGFMGFLGARLATPSSSLGK